MKLKSRNTLIITTFFCCTVISCNNKCVVTDLYKGAYPDNNMPGTESRLFSPGFVNTGMITRDIAITPDMKELYFSVATPGYRYATIMVTKRVDEKWTEPVAAPHMNTPGFINFEPCISPDGEKFFFLSSRPDPNKQEEVGDQDIWCMDRTGDTWSEPYNLGEPVCSDANEYFPSVTREGTLYFTRTLEDANYIYRSNFINGKYQEPVMLPDQVNTGTTRFNAYISPDEDYIIIPVAGKEESIGGSTDYYIVFRNMEDRWSEPINMGKEINTRSNQEQSCYVSPDKQFFFFASAKLVPPDSIRGIIPDGNIMKLYSLPETGNANIYWISAEIIDNLRKEAIFDLQNQ